MDKSVRGEAAVAASLDGHTVVTAADRPITVVTGGSEGIGCELARRFARAGHSIALVARQPDALARAAAEIRSQGGTVLEIPLDVGQPDAGAVLEAALARHGYHVDVLINNAGFGMAGDFAGLPAAETARLIEVNVAAPTRLTRHFLPGMLVRRRGGVLNVASLGGYAPGPFQATYYASKAYLIALSEAIAWEVLGTGVRVAVLAPGPVETLFHARMGGETANYRWLMPSMSPRRVARAGYWGYRLGRRVIVPGVLWPLMALAMRLLPHIVLLPVMGWLLRPGLPPATDAGGRSRQ